MSTKFSAIFKSPSGPYIAGYIFSLSLTLVAFALVWWQVNSDSQVFSDGFLLAWVAALAMVQLLTQLVFFLHLGRESKPRWNLAVLSFAATIVIILVFGSLWIMQNLNYHDSGVQDPRRLESEIIQDEGFDH